MMKRMLRTLPFLLLPFGLVAPWVQAEVVRCTDARGATVYTDGACPSGSKSAQPVTILESPPPEASRMPDDAPARAAPAPVVQAAPPAPAVATRPQGPAVIPRFPNEQVAQEPQPDPAWSDGAGYPYAYPYPYPPPIRRPRVAPHVTPDPPLGHRLCQNLSGLKRYNC